MRIRTAIPADFDAIYQLVATAFQTARVSDGDEQAFVLRLRAGNNYLPHLELVAEEEGRLLGHVMLTRQPVERAGDSPYVGLLLAPLSVVLERRGQGIGGRLLRQACHLGREAGYGAIFLVGDPAYYRRFGFEATTRWGITNTNGIPDPFVQARELNPGVLASVKGTITFAT